MVHLRIDQQSSERKKSSFSYCLDNLQLERASGTRLCAPGEAPAFLEVPGRIMGHQLN